jgi:hypothetical protein
MSDAWLEGGTRCVEAARPAAGFNKGPGHMKRMLITLAFTALMITGAQARDWTTRMAEHMRDASALIFGGVTPEDRIFASSFELPVAASLEFVTPVQSQTVYTAGLAAKVMIVHIVSPIESVTINGVSAAEVSISDDTALYGASVTLAPGDNIVRAQVRFADGAVLVAEIKVLYVQAARVTITSPADWSTFGPLQGAPGSATNLTGSVERPITITGIVSAPAERVEINQQLAQLEPGGEAFRFERFFLHEGTNLVSVSARDAKGRVSTANITVYVDQTAPLLTVEGVGDAAQTSANRIDLRGVVNDAVEGGLNAPEPSVTVLNATASRSVAATVSDRFYIAADVPLEVGDNELVVTARDAVGNSRSRTVRVTRTLAGSQRITLLRGNRQRAPVRTELAEPLVIAAIDANGLPLSELPVHFDVLRGAGSISTLRGAATRPDGVNEARHLVVNTDAAGRAQVWLTTGSEASEAGNMVRARSLTQSEDVLFTATGLRGEPSQVLIAGSAGSQYAQTSSQPVDALSVVVQDGDGNPTIGTPVTFGIEKGDAFFTSQSAPKGTPSQDGRSISTLTDKNGLASVRPLIGESAGMVEVSARAMRSNGDLAGDTRLRVIVLERREGATGFGGLVFDHGGTPLPGIALSITRTALIARSDTEGRFLFEDGVPPGKIDLLVDGRGVNISRNGRSLEYPGLHFETAIIQGQLNQLPHPIYLPSIDRSRESIVGGDSDVSLTIPGLDGFEMRVQANSVTFPDGSHVGPLVVTAVNGDRLPMVPPGGYASFGSVAWTIQPTGTRFDPPIQVKIPNVTGMKPGETNDIVQWDHDLATFVPMGRGTVSEDGTQLVTDPGSGITKAGWGGGPPPVPPNDGDNQCRISRAQARPAWERAGPFEVDFPSIRKLGLMKATESANQVPLSCVKCQDGARWEIAGGDALVLTITVTKNLPITPTGLKERTAAQIAESKAHEKVHQDKMFALRDKHISYLNDTWSSKRECDQGIVSAKEKFQKDWNIEEYRQCMHFDHSGQPIFTVDSEGNQVETGLHYPLNANMVGQPASEYRYCQNLKPPHEY